MQGKALKPARLRLIRLIGSELNFAESISEEKKKRGAWEGGRDHESGVSHERANVSVLSLHADMMSPMLTLTCSRSHSFQRRSSP